MGDKTQVTYTTKWEVVSNYCKRLKVPGGWIVCVWNDRNVNSLCFLPDQNYAWVISD